MIQTDTLESQKIEIYGKYTSETSAQFRTVKNTEIYLFRSMIKINSVSDIINWCL